MEQVRQFASMLCVSAVGCCALKMLLPDSALENVLKVILSVFFLLCLLSPLRGASLSLPDRGDLEEAAAPAAEELSQAYGEHLEKAVADNVSRVAAARLERLGLEETELNLKTNVNIEDGDRIDISGIEVFLREEDAPLAGRIRDCIEGELELSCTIHVEGGDGGARAGEEEQDGN